MNAMKVRWKGETEFLMLTHDKVYTVLGMEKGWYRLVDDSGEDYLYPPENFEREPSSVAEGSPFGRAVEQSETERARTLR